MAASQVQANGGVGATPFGLALGASTPVNNLILVFFDFGVANAFTSIADDIGNAYTQIGSEIAGTSHKSRAYWARNSTAGVRTVTVTTSAGNIEIDIEEVTGTVRFGSPIDAQAGTVHNGVTADYTDSITLNGADSLVVAFAQDAIGNASITTAGYSSDSTANGNILGSKQIVGSGSTGVTFNSANFPTADDTLTWVVGILSEHSPRIVMPTIRPT